MEKVNNNEIHCVPNNFLLSRFFFPADRSFRMPLRILTQIAAIFLIEICETIYIGELSYLWILLLFMLWTLFIGSKMNTDTE